jgi:hypothetical protein
MSITKKNKYKAPRFGFHTFKLLRRCIGLWLIEKQKEYCAITKRGARGFCHMVNPALTVLGINIDSLYYTHKYISP